MLDYNTLESGFLCYDAVINFDPNGYPDIATANYYGQSVSVLYNTLPEPVYGRSQAGRIAVFLPSRLAPHQSRRISVMFRM